MTSEIAARLQSSVIAPLKQQYVGREEVIDLIALALTAGEHLFLYGPPGTAKSALIRSFAQMVQGNYFEYLLTRFSEPNEIFGPIDLVRLREGTVATVIRQMLPEAEFAFLDELFNANSAILNHLLTVLNERIYRRGAEIHSLPLLSLFSASNHLPEDDTLGALFDRFLLRCRVEPLPRAEMPRLLDAGWAIESARNRPSDEKPPGVTAADLRKLSQSIFEVRLDAVRDGYTEAVFRIRDLGISMSDRRAVRVMKLIAASAVLCGRQAAEGSDLWVLRYVWDRAEQIGPLRTLVQGFLDQSPGGNAHPLAASQEKSDPEAIARQLDSMDEELRKPSPGLATISRIRENLTRLNDQTSWVSDDTHRKHLLERIGLTLKKIGT